MWLLTLILAVLAVVIAILLVKEWRRYWSKKNISTPPWSPLFGHIIQLNSGKKWDFINDNYRKYKEEKVFGIFEFFRPTLFICDRKIIKQILVTNFDNFTDRRDSGHIPQENKWFKEMLNIISEADWARLRHTVSPVFTVDVRRRIYPSVNRIQTNLVEHLQEQMESVGKVDVMKSFSLYCLDVLSSIAFGVDCEALFNHENEFYFRAEELFAESPKKKFYFLFSYLFPKLAYFFEISMVDEKWEYFRDITKASIAVRRSLGEKKGDLLDVLLEIEENQKHNFDEKLEYKITDDTILAQSITFLVIGYDAMTSVLSMVVHFLAKYPEKQDALRKELLQLQATEEETTKINFNTLENAHYLEACVFESLRLIPPLAKLERVCVKDFEIDELALIIPKGMHVEIPSWGLQHDPEFWTEPELFQPERFLPENRKKNVPYTYMPLGLGARDCMASDLAYFILKSCIAGVIINYQCSFAEGYGNLELETGSRVIRPADDNVVIRFEKIKK